MAISAIPDAAADRPVRPRLRPVLQGAGTGELHRDGRRHRLQPGGGRDTARSLREVLPEGVRGLREFQDRVR